METPRLANSDLKLDRLLRAYRESCPDPEPGVNFMPELWARIESRNTFSFFVRRLSSRFLTAAVALTLAMAAYLYYPGTAGPYYSESYVDALAAPYVDSLMAHVNDSVDLLEPTGVDLSDSAGEL